MQIEGHRSRSRLLPIRSRMNRLEQFLKFTRCEIARDHAAQMKL